MGNELNEIQPLKMETSFESSIVPLAGTCSGTTGYPEFSKLIELTTYKPYTQLYFVGYDEVEQATIGGIKLFPDNEPVPLARLILKYYTQDSRNPKAPKNILEFMMPVPRDIEFDQGYREHFLRNFFESFEMHESAEWFKINGELVNDPHASQKQRENRI